MISPSIITAMMIKNFSKIFSCFFSPDMIYFISSLRDKKFKDKKTMVKSVKKGSSRIMRDLSISVVSPSVFPDQLKSEISHLRLWGVYSPLVRQVVFHSVSRNECVNYLKSSAKVCAGYVVRFDSAY